MLPSSSETATHAQVDVADCGVPAQLARESMRFSGMNPAPVPAVAEGQMAEVVERVAKLEERFDAVTQRLDRIEVRLGTGLAEVKQSITRVEGRLDAGLVEVNRRLDAGLTEVKQSIARLDDRLESRFKWLLGGIASTVLASVLTLIGVLFGK